MNIKIINLTILECKSIQKVYQGHGLKHHKSNLIGM